MVHQRTNGTVNNHGLLLCVSTLLFSMATACSQQSQTTQSGQTANQPVSQATYQPVFEEEVFTVVQEPPGFPGGNDQISSYLQQNLRYPEAAIKAKVAGRVFVSFIVANDGHLRDIDVLKGYGHGINEEAIRLVQTMPNWIPGKQAGRFVNVKYTLVIPFTLDSLK